MIGITPLELNGMVGRTQDFSAVRQGELDKPVVDQSQIQGTVEQTREQMSSTVVQQNNVSGDSADGQGSAFYEGDGGRRRKKKQEVPDEGRVVVKGHGHFEVTI